MTDQVSHAAMRMVGVAGALVHVKLVAHLAADGPVKVARLVLAKADVALEPRVCDALRVVGVGTTAAVDGELLEQAGKVLRTRRVEVAVLGVGLAPVHGRHEVANSAAWAARLGVPGAAAEAVVLYHTRKLRLVLDTSICNTVASKECVKFDMLGVRVRKGSGSKSVAHRSLPQEATPP